MSTILDLLYREYCRARLTEMRKQLLLSVPNNEMPAANSDASDPSDQNRGLGNEAATTKLPPSGRRVS
jgi:hypothetical protein